MKKFVLAISVVLAGCASGETTGSLYSGQWNPPQNIGGGKYLIQGFSTTSAIRGGTEYCLIRNKEFVAELVTPHTRSEVATVTFVCR